MDEIDDERNKKKKRNNSCARIFVQIQNNTHRSSILGFCGEKVMEKEGAGHESNAGT